MAARDREAEQKIRRVGARGQERQQREADECGQHRRDPAAELRRNDRGRRQKGAAILVGLRKRRGQLRRKAGHFGLRLLEGHAGRETSQQHQPVVRPGDRLCGAAVDFGPGGVRIPDVRVKDPVHARERRRRDTEDRQRCVFEAEGTADDVRIRAEPLPQRLADDDELTGRAGIGGKRQRPETRGDAEHVEVVRGNADADESLLQVRGGHRGEAFRE